MGTECFAGVNVYARETPAYPLHAIVVFHARCCRWEGGSNLAAPIRSCRDGAYLAVRIVRLAQRTQVDAACSAALLGGFRTLQFSS
jgi:hypothetical protein